MNNLFLKVIILLVAWVMLGGILLIARPLCVIPAALVTLALFKVSGGDQIVKQGGDFWTGYLIMFAMVLPIVAIVWTVGTALRKRLTYTVLD